MRVKERGREKEKEKDRVRNAKYKEVTPTMYMNWHKRLNTNYNVKWKKCTGTLFPSYNWLWDHWPCGFAVVFVTLRTQQSNWSEVIQELQKWYKENLQSDETKQKNMLTKFELDQWCVVRIPGGNKRNIFCTFGTVKQYIVCLSQMFLTSRRGFIF